LRNLSLQDEELYLRVKRGDMSAFDLLYSRHQRGLFQFVSSYLKSQEEAEEVFHDAFIQVLDSREVHFDQGSFKGWLYLVARNISLNRLRSRKRSERVLSEVDASLPEESAEALLIQNVTSSHVSAAVADLPDNLSEVLRLRLSGLAYQDIAQALEIPVGTVKSRFHTIVDSLRRSLKSLNDSEVQ
jgi:RNA polymerase sigma-70 factor, ECF subfamily